MLNIDSRFLYEYVSSWKDIAKYILKSAVIIPNDYAYELLLLGR